MGQLADGPMGHLPEGHAPKVLVQSVSFHEAQITVESGVIPSLMMVFVTSDGEQHPYIFDKEMLVPMMEGALMEAGIIQPMVEGEVVDDDTD